MDSHEHNAFPVVSEGRIGGNLVPTVDARDLHAFLEVETRYNDWIANRIRDFGFSENTDFVTLTENLVSGGKRTVHRISLDMGKELGMVERTDKGKEVRRYFIECEKRALVKAVSVPTTAEAFANAFMMIAEAQRVQTQHAAKIAAIDEKIDRIEQALTILDKVPPNGELVTYMRKRVKKEFGLAPEVTNKILDVFSVHPKFAVRNHHERADGGVNYGYWKREINAVVRRFIGECIQVTPAMCEHPSIEGRFRFAKPASLAPRRGETAGVNNEQREGV